MPCKKELEREARIILQVMMRHKHKIKNLPLGEVALYICRHGQMSFVKKLPVGLVEFMHQNNWLNLKDGVYADTEAGHIWLSEFIYFLDLKRPNNNDYYAKPEPKQNLRENLSLSEKSTIAMGNADGEFSPILKLYNRQRNIVHKYLTPIHLQAGQKIFETFMAANLQPSITMDWERLQSVPQNHYMGQSKPVHSEKAHIAREQLSQCLEAVGQEYAAILVEICIFGNGLEATERAMNWPARSGKLLLTMALDKLAEHYKIMLPDRHENKYLAWAKHGLDSNFDKGI